MSIRPPKQEVPLCKIKIDVKKDIAEAQKETTKKQVTFEAEEKLKERNTEEKLYNHKSSTEMLIKEEPKVTFEQQINRSASVTD